MSKAYDRVELVWLEEIMENLGFHNKWRELMMRCISFVTYVVKINPLRSYHPNEWFTPRDLLSPYLFLISTEGFLAMIQKVIGVGTLKVVLTCKRGPSVSHLLFADDILILCKATIEECEAL